jgi:hypothetical protein
MDRGQISPDMSASVREFLSGLNAGIPDPGAFMGTNPLELAAGRIHPAQSEWRSRAIAH